MGKINEYRNDGLQRGTKPTRSCTVSGFSPWIAVILWIAVTLPSSWGYLLAGLSPTQADVDRATTGKLQPEIRPANVLSLLPRDTLTKEQIGRGHASTFPEHGSEMVNIAEVVPASFLPAAAREVAATIANNNNVTGGRPSGNNSSEKHLLGSSGTGLISIVARKIKPHLEHSFASRRSECISSNGSGCTLQTNNRREDKHRLSFSETAVKAAAAHKHDQRSRNEEPGREGRMTRATGTQQPRENPRRHLLIPTEPTPPATSLLLRHCHNITTAEEKKKIDRSPGTPPPSFVNSGTTIIDELMATALATSSAFLTPQSATPAMNYIPGGPQMQPALSPAHSIVSMSLPQPVRQESQLEDVEIVFISIGCVVAILLVVLVWFLLRGQKNWRVR